MGPATHANVVEPVSWDAYFNAVFANPVAAAGSGLRDLLQNRSAGSEAAFGKHVGFQVTDLVAGVPKTTSVTDVESLRRALEDETWQERKGVRLVSLGCTRTIGPLGITSALAAELLVKYRVAPEFLRVLLSFGRATPDVESPCGHVSCQTRSNGDAVVCYNLNYFERNQAKRWAARHIGVYHHHHAGAGASLFILLASQPQTAFFESLVDLGLLQGSSSAPASSDGSHAAARWLETSPASLHAALMSCYVDRWKIYFDSLGREFRSLNDAAMTATLAKLEVATFHRHILRLRSIHEKALFAGASCAGNVDIAAALAGHWRGRLGQPAEDEDGRSLSSSADVLRGLARGCAVLRDEIKNASSLVDHYVSTHHQIETVKLEAEVHEMTKRMVALAGETTELTRELRAVARETGDMTRAMQEMARDSSSDGKIVFVITLISAVYLPSSFVATIFGTNFFNFDADNRRIQLAPDIVWIFLPTVVASIALTGAAFVAIHCWVKPARVLGRVRRWW